MFRRTTAINKLRAMKARKRVVQGGSSAGKTQAILAILIDQAAKKPGLEMSVVSESIPHLKKGALKDFIKIMKFTGRWNQDRYNATDRKYTFSNGSHIEFFSPEAVLGARRNILFINEANNIRYEDYYQLAIRTSGDIWIDFNPSNEFWAHTEVLKEPDAEGIILTYLDNEARPVNVDADFAIARQKAKTSKYWANWCRVYIDGEIGILQGAVIPNWEIINELPAEAKLLRHGLDFGYHPDPLGCISIFQWNGGIVLRENIYKTNMGISEMVAALKVLERKDIICDNSQPLIIDELKRAGLPAKPCVKGKDSVEYGIEKLNQQKIYVLASSTNLINELRNYVRDTDTNQPIDSYNHLIDPTRYAFVTEPAHQPKARVY